jgi:hypothetical protein
MHQALDHSVLRGRREKHAQLQSTEWRSDVLAHSLRELIDLYTFEYDVIDTRRVNELQRELDALPATSDERDA